VQPNGAHNLQDGITCPVPEYNNTKSQSFAGCEPHNKTASRCLTAMEMIDA